MMKGFLITTPEEFFVLVEEDNYEYKNLRYHSVILRRTPEHNRLKGREEAAKYIVELLDGVNFKSTNRISPKEEDKCRFFLQKLLKNVWWPALSRHSLPHFTNLVQE